jgi:hypothetical protein
MAATGVMRVTRPKVPTEKECSCPHPSLLQRAKFLPAAKCGRFSSNERLGRLAHPRLACCSENGAQRLVEVRRTEFIVEHWEKRRAALVFHAKQEADDFSLPTSEPPTTVGGAPRTTTASSKHRVIGNAFRSGILPCVIAQLSALQPSASGSG